MRYNAKSWLLALLLHAVLLVLCCANDDTSTRGAGIPAEPIVTVFITRAVVSHPMLSQSSIAATVPALPQAPTHVSTQAMHTHGEDRLAERLHALIEAQQRYPEDALFAEVTGQATVQFLLHPDGQVSNVQLIASAGFASLDRAAIDAVRGISPVDQVRLSSPKVFTVNVEFVQQL